MHARIVQYIGILLAIFAIAGGYFYFRSHAAVTDKSANKNGLVGYWPLNEGTGTQAGDASGQGNTGTLVASPTWITGKLGPALTFNGTNQIMSVSTPNNLNFQDNTPLSFVAWVKSSNAVGGEKGIASTVTNGSTGGVIFNMSHFSGGKIGLEIVNTARSAGRAAYESTAVNDGVWHHVVATYDGSGSTSGIIFYIDGISKTTVSVTNTSPGSIANAASFFVGGVSQASHGFPGSIDDVRIYNRVLGATEITNLYNLGAARLEASQNSQMTNGLVGLWSFDGKDIAGTTAYDRSSSGNNGTLTGGPTSVLGQLGQALSFNGTSQTVTGSAVSISNGSYTLSAWARRTSASASGNYIFEQGSAGTSLFMGFSAVSSFECSVWGSNFSVAIVNDTNFHLWTCTYDSGLNQRKIYRDGVNIASGAGGNFAVPPSGFKIGNAPDIGNVYFGGTIDDVRVYNRALSAGDVWTLYQMGKPDAVNSADSQIDPLNKGIVGYWKLDDGSGTSAADASGNANTGTLVSSPTWGAGKIGGAVTFNGTSQYVDMGSAGSGTSLAITGNLTLSAWIKRAAVPEVDQDRVILERNDSTGSIETYYFEVGGGHGLADGYLSSGFDKGGGQYQGVNTASAVITDKNWHHVVAVRSGSIITMYVDGVSVVSGSTTGTPVTGTAHVIIGSSNISYNNTRKWNGSLDDVRIYNRALSQDEVAKLYQSTAPASPNTSLVGYWPFNGPDLSGTTVYDRSGKGSNGTLTNSPTKSIGKIGQGMSFNGTNQYIDVPYANLDFEYNAPFSISGWVNLIDVSNTTPALLGRFSGAISKGIGLILPRSSISGLLYGACNPLNSNSAILMLASGINNTALSVETPTSSVLPGSWKHIVATYDGSSLVSGTKIYVDGASQALTTCFNTLGSNSIRPGINWHIGDDYTSDYVKGSLDEVRIYNRVLSQAEVSALYNAGK